MRNKISTTLARWQGVTQLSLEESALVEDISACKLSPNDFTYTIPITATARCPWCLATVAPVTLTSGHEFNLELDTGDHDELRALLTAPHRCPELYGDRQ